MMNPTKILHNVYEKIHGFDPMADTTINEVRGYLGIGPLEKGDKHIRVPEDLLEYWRKEFENSSGEGSGGL